MQRRTVLKRLAVSAALALAGLAVGTHVQAAEGTIKVGVLHSLSGTMAISETVLKDVTLMAIDEINAKGGVMGKKLEAVVVDPASNWPLFAEKARELYIFLQEQRVTSADTYGAFLEREVPMLAESQIYRLVHDDVDVDRVELPSRRTEMRNEVARSIG